MSSPTSLSEYISRLLLVTFHAPFLYFPEIINHFALRKIYKILEISPENKGIREQGTRDGNY